MFGLAGDVVESVDRKHGHFNAFVLPDESIEMSIEKGELQIYAHIPSFDVVANPARIDWNVCEASVGLNELSRMVGTPTVYLTDQSEKYSHSKEKLKRLIQKEKQDAIEKERLQKEELKKEEAERIEKRDKRLSTIEFLVKLEVENCKKGIEIYDVSSIFNRSEFQKIKSKITSLINEANSLNKGSGLTKLEWISSTENQVQTCEVTLDKLDKDYKDKKQRQKEERINLLLNDKEKIINDMNNSNHIDDVKNFEIRIKRINNTSSRFNDKRIKEIERVFHQSYINLVKRSFLGEISLLAKPIDYAQPYRKAITQACLLDKTGNCDISIPQVHLDAARERTANILNSFVAEVIKETRKLHSDMQQTAPLLSELTLLIALNQYLNKHEHINYSNGYYKIVAELNELFKKLKSTNSRFAV